MQNRLCTWTTALAGAIMAVAMVPGVAWGLGLGGIQSNTRIGQQFQARIPILGASPGDLQGLTVDLAGPAAYKSAGLSEPDFLFNLKFSVKQGPKGPYVEVTSQHPVRLPFLNLLVHVSWPSGDITRQYTVLLNPPVFAAGTSAQPVAAPSSPAAQNVSTQQAAAPPPPTPAQPQPQPQPQPTVSASAPPSQPTTVHSYGPVPRGATLWGLARRLRPDNSISVNQMMIALYRANPDAFVGNINRLKAGYVLKVPGRSAIAQVSTREATRNVASQDQAWHQARARYAARQSPAPAPATSTKAQGPSAEQAASSAASSSKGQVVLTTPQVTTPEGAVAPGTATTGESTKGTQVAGAAAAAAATTAGGAAAAGTGASIGGPLKVKSNQMAALAAGSTAAAAGKAGTKPGGKTGSGPSNGSKTSNTTKTSNTSNASRVSNATNAVNTVSTGVGTAGTAPWWKQWIKGPSEWIIIGAVALILFALAMILVRRRRAAAVALAGGGTMPLGEGGRGDTGAFESGTDDGEPDGGARGAQPGDGPESGEESEAEAYIGAPTPTVGEADPVAEADFHAGYGEYEQATQVLRDAITREPESSALQRKLLEVLFAAGDADTFVTEAQAYRNRFGGEDADGWREIAMMGRQLAPESQVFGAPGSAAEQPESDKASLDFDLELDRLSGTQAADGGTQDEFERTMDELSTFIETYVPGSGETPIELQLPPDEQPAQAGGSNTAAAEADEPLEFNLDDEDLGGATAVDEQAPERPSGNEDQGIEFDLGPLDGPEGSGGQPAQEAPASEEEPEAEVEDENVVDTKLDLARAYLDMGDPDSARGVLEEVVDEGDEAQRNEATRLLGSLS